MCKPMKNLIQLSVRVVKNKFFRIVFISVLSAYLLNLFFLTYSLRSPFVFYLQSPIVEKVYGKTIIKQIIVTPTPIKKAEPKAEPKKQSSNPKVLKGFASHYNRAGCLGCDDKFIMANGKELIDADLTLALAPEVVNQYKLLNDNVRIKNVKTGAEAIVRVTDTGGFTKERCPSCCMGNGCIADMTDGTRDAIGCRGICEVEVYL